MDKEIKQQFELINKKLNAIAAGQRKETWISYSWIQKITGWDKEELRMAREQKIVEVKRHGTSDWLYKLESIPEQFIKQKQAS
jgi:hypothetical protein